MRPTLAVLSVALSLTATARAEVVAGPEIDVDERVLVPAVGEQTAANLAFDGENFLLTWRSAIWRDELRATRVSPTGAVLDGRGIRIDGLERAAGAAAVIALPAKAGAAGRGFFVAWARPSGDVAGARVEAKNPLALAAPVVLDPGAPGSPAGAPALVASEDTLFVGFARAGAEPALDVVTFPLEGTTARAKLRLAGREGAVTLQRNGDVVVAVYAVPREPVNGVVDGVEVFVARIDGKPGSRGELLAPIGPPVLTLAGELPGPLAAATAPTGEILVAASSWVGGRVMEARFVRLAAGTYAPTPLGAQTFCCGLDRLALAWEGAGFLALWSGGTPAGGPAVAGARVTGDVITPLAAGDPALAPAGAARAPALSPTPLGLFAAWDEVASRTAGAVTDSDVRFARLGADLRPAFAPALASLGTNSESEPTVAASPRRVLVTFEDRRSDRAGSDIYGALLDREGARTGTPPIAIGTGPAAQTLPVVTWDGASFVVAWHEGKGGLYVARVSEEGALAAPPVRIADTADATWLSEPALCADGDGALLVYAVRRTGVMDLPRTSELRARRIPRGAAIDTAPDDLLTTTADVTSAPTIRMGCNDRAALLAFTSILTPLEVSSRLLIARISRGAQTLSPIPGLVRMPGRIAQEWAGIGTDGAGFMVTWRAVDRMGGRAVFSVRVDPDGFLLDDAPWKVGNANSGRRMTTVWDGQQYVVFAVTTNNGAPYDLIGHRVGKSGAIFERDWFKVATLTVPWASAGLGSDAVALAPGRLFVTYEQFADDDASGNPRARARVLTTPLGTPLPPPEGGPPDPRPDAGADATTPDADDAATDAATDATADAATDATADARPRGGPEQGCTCHIGRASAPGAVPLLLAIGLIARLFARGGRKSVAVARA